MTEDKLIAEIADNEIRYIICKQNSEIEYKVLNKKVSVNTGIHRGKIINFDHTLKKINDDVKNIEKESSKIFKNISIVINEPEMLCTNITGIKNLNGSRVEKRDLDYIINEAKSSIIKNQEKNSILHILNSNYILDKKEKSNIPLNLRGDQLGLHMTFISLPTDKLKNISSLFNNNDIKVDRFVSKPFAYGIDLLKKKKNLKNFTLINLEKEMTSISLYEDSSLIFLRTYPFGTNSIYRDIMQLCSLTQKEILPIINNLNLKNEKIDKKIYIDKSLFTDSEFKHLSVNHIKEIINTRIIEMTNYTFNKNKNLKYLNKKDLEIYLFFEDENILKKLSHLFENSLKTSSSFKKIESLSQTHFTALSGAAELILNGWYKEAIPLKNRKKSIISSFFERFF